MSLRDRKREKVRREMALAAVRLFDERGFSATTVEQIADAADYSASSVFRYFPTKEDLVFYDLPEMMDRLRSRLQDAAEGDAWTIVRSALIDFAAELEAADSAFVEARIRLLQKEPALQRRYTELCFEMEGVIAQLFAAERGVDPEQDAFCQLAAGAFVIAQRTAHRTQHARGGSLVEHVQGALNVLESGFHPRRTKRRAG